MIKSYLALIVVYITVRANMELFSSPPNNKAASVCG